MMPLGLVPLAAEPAAGIWGQPVVLALIVLVGTVITAAATAFAAIKVKKMNRPVDDATTKRTEVEADKVRVDIHGREVEIARGLLDEMRKELDRVRSVQERDRQALEQRLAEQAVATERRHLEMIQEAEKRHDALCEELDRVKARQTALQNRMTEHAPWDAAATVLLRQQDPTFPDPPPLVGD